MTKACSTLKQAFVITITTSNRQCLWRASLPSLATSIHGSLSPGAFLLKRNSVIDIIVMPCSSLILRGATPESRRPQNPNHSAIFTVNLNSRRCKPRLGSCVIVGGIRFHQILLLSISNVSENILLTFNQDIRFQQHLPSSTRHLP